MNKKKFITGSILIFSFLLPAAKADNLTQLIVEKKLDVDRKTGFILSSELKTISELQPPRATVIASQVKPVPPDMVISGEKTYSIVNEPDAFYSLISVKDINGNEIKRISVGRKALKIITAAKSNHLFVLCGGYFGSVWEINPDTNQVIRKFSTSWNPTDLVIDSAEKFLYVTSGKLQKFTLDSDIVLDIDLPLDIRYLNCVNLLNSSTLIFGGINMENLQQSYKINNFDNKLIPSEIQAVYQSSTVKSVYAQPVLSGGNGEISFVYSKNNDYLYLFSLEKGEIDGIIPLDAKADEVMIVAKQNKALVLHRDIGQISVLDLKPGTATQYSVVARIMDDRLKDPSNSMVLEGTKVFIKSDSAQEGYIDTDNILRYTYPIVEIPLVRNRITVAVANLANKRFILKNNQLFVEDIIDNSITYSRKTPLNAYGENIGGIAISPDEKVLYLSNPSQNAVFAVNVFTNNILAKYSVGSEPAELAVNNKYLFVLNKGEQSISTVDLKSGQTLKINRVKVENNNLNIIKLYDREFDQIIKVTLAQVVNKELSMVKAEN